MNQPKPSIKMTLRLLLLWLKSKATKALLYLKNKFLNFNSEKNRQGFKIQGAVPKQLKKEGQTFSIDSFGELLKQGKNIGDDLYFDYADKDKATHTLRIVRTANQNICEVEVLPNFETKGVYAKESPISDIRETIESVIGNTNKGWLQRNGFYYKAWQA